MANLIPISTVVVGSGGAASIEFSNIPASYTDLMIILSVRETTGGVGVLKLTFNNSSSGYTARQLVGSGSSAFSDTQYGGTWYGAEANANPDAYTSNTFSNTEYYIPNYASSNNKSISTNSVNENNATNAYSSISAGLWSNTAPINNIKITQYSNTNLAQYSSATLYGIRKY